ncbi:nuclear pore complex protein Nup107-like [Trifolium medium]|uniref:Nuclear pore complex protein Nup107-like n=1 Tax=Trifolium medium TaxID=97028 RepID=A0A392MHI1_9FABA|nr:nuclear pore complex protein Nup107-like [Trifolium medium]
MKNGKNRTLQAVEFESGIGHLWHWRYLLHDEEMEAALRDKILSVGDHILHLYAQFLFSKEHEEELVGIYASQLARQRCIDPLCSHDMELRLHSRCVIIEDDLLKRELSCE